MKHFSIPPTRDRRIDNNLHIYLNTSLQKSESELESDRHRSLRSNAAELSKWFPILGTNGTANQNKHCFLNFASSGLHFDSPFLWLELLLLLFTIMALLLLLILLIFIAVWLLVELSALSESESLSSSFESLEDDELSSPIYQITIKNESKHFLLVVKNVRARCVVKSQAE